MVISVTVTVNLNHTVCDSECIAQNCRGSHVPKLGVPVLPPFIFLFPSLFLLPVTHQGVWGVQTAEPDHQTVLVHCEFVPMRRISKINKMSRTRELCSLEANYKSQGSEMFWVSGVYPQHWQCCTIRPRHQTEIVNGAHPGPV